MNIEYNSIKLKHGCIDIGLTEKGVDGQKYTTIEVCVFYVRNDLNFRRHKKFNSLQDAYAWYEKQDLNMRGA